jgi:hypothetical protein
MREVAEMLCASEEAFVADHSKCEMAFGKEVTPHCEGIRRTSAWYRRCEEGVVSKAR